MILKCESKEEVEDDFGGDRKRNEELKKTCVREGDLKERVASQREFLRSECLGFVQR